MLRQMLLQIDLNDQQNLPNVRQNYKTVQKGHTFANCSKIKMLWQTLLQ